MSDGEDDYDEGGMGDDLNPDMPDGSEFDAEGDDDYQGEDGQEGQDREDEDAEDVDVDGEDEEDCDYEAYEELSKSDAPGTSHSNVPTTRHITKYELARVLSERSCQLIAGAPPMIPVDRSKYQCEFEIAKTELLAGKLPLIIERPLPNGAKVLVRVCDLVVSANMIP